MAKEIERKFLVTSDEFKSLATPLHCKQGYFQHDSEPLVRVRIMGDKAFLTIKGENTGITRLEFEYEIPVEDAEYLLQQFCTSLIEKKRYHIQYHGFLWEVDEFLGDNSGLIVAEIELEYEHQSFDIPNWVGSDVSTDEKYYNYKLLTHPFKDWGDENEI